MGSIKQDLYILGQSQSQSVKIPRQEIRLDLQLFPQPLLETGKVTGIVTDSKGNPIPNALVKIMDSNYNPIEHAITAEDGSHVIHNLPVGIDYTIFATAAGKALNQGTPFKLTAGGVVTRNFVLSDDPSTQLGVIAGDLYDFDSNTPLEGAVISLYSNPTPCTEVLIAITYTNEYGQFVFRELELNKYTIRVHMLGYYQTSTKVSIDTCGQIIPSDIYLKEDPNSSRGTISGMITDNNNHPIPYADVILYRVNTDNTLTAVSFTKTNSSGVYVFMNIDQAKYVVKSNQMKQTTLN